MMQQESQVSRQITGKKLNYHSFTGIFHTGSKISGVQ